MKCLTKIAVFVVALAVVTGLAVFAVPAVVKAAEDWDTIFFDVACDCRTASPSFFTGSRGDAFIVSGKIFPAGTLPSGEASNDPTQPVDGHSSIGDWTCRGQVAGAFPPEIAAAYESTPFAWNTQYFILRRRGTLTVEGYAIPPGAELLSITGGIKGFSGASGFTEENPLGTNITGCPNFRAKFRLRSGSRRN
jgi:hypothetical protein